MSEVKNEGLEVVAFTNAASAAGVTLSGNGFYLDYNTELCVRSEALAGYAVRDSRIAELERGLSLYETAYKDECVLTDELSAELAAIKSAPVAKQVVMPVELSNAFITCESFGDSYRVVIQSKTLEETQSVHNWIVRLNAADHAESGANFCNKCGYCGPMTTHNRPHDGVVCSYAAASIKKGDQDE